MTGAFVISHSGGRTTNDRDLVGEDESVIVGFNGTVQLRGGCLGYGSEA